MLPRPIVSIMSSTLRPVDAGSMRGGLWSGQNTLQSLRPLGSEGRMGRHIPGTRNGRRTSCAGPDRQLGREGASMRIWRQRGEHQQAIGRSRGGRTTKIYALTDAECRPVAFLLTGGQIADCTAGAVLLEQMPCSAILHGDKGYDSDAIRRQVEGKVRCRTSRPRRPTLEELLLARPLSKPQRHRAYVLSPEGLPPHRHQI